MISRIEFTRPEASANTTNNGQNQFSNVVDLCLKIRKHHSTRSKDSSYASFDLLTGPHRSHAPHLSEFVTNYPPRSAEAAGKSVRITKLDTDYGWCDRADCRLAEFGGAETVIVSDDAQASELEDLVASCGLPLGYANEITVALQNASAFISSRGAMHDVQHELFVDYEFPDWKMVKTTFRINADFARIRNEFKEPVYRIIISKLPDHILENIIIKFEPL